MVQIVEIFAATFVQVIFGEEDEALGFAERPVGGDVVLGAWLS